MPCALKDGGELCLRLPGLFEKDQATVDDGNASLDFLIVLIKLCLKQDVMLVVENPSTSRLLVAPTMRGPSSKRPAATT